MTTISINQYKTIMGKIPRRHELAQWREKDFISFFQFIQRYTNDNGKIGVTKIRMKANEDDILNAPPSFHAELLYRVGFFTTSPQDVPSRYFQKKIEGFAGSVGEYLKGHPALITAAMEEELKKTPPMHYVLSTYKTVTTEIGAKITMPDVQGGTKPVPVPDTPEVILATAQLKIASIIQMAIEDVKKSDIKDMSPKDKLALVTKLWPIATASKFRPGMAVFQQININRGGREDLEKAMLDFGKVREQQDE